MPSLTSLAEKALESAKQLDAHLLQRGPPYTSLDDDTLRDIPEELRAERDILVDTSHTLKRLALGTDGLYWELLFNFVDELSLRLVYAYGFAEHVPLNGTTTFPTIAKASSTSESFVERVLRHAMANGIFTEDASGAFGHTTASRALVTDPDLRDAVGMMACDISPAASCALDALQKWPNSGEQTETAFTLRNEPGVSMFQILARQPERARRFGAGMRYYGRAETGNLRWLTGGYPWASMDNPETIFVDVGGGQGTCSRAIASTTQHMKFIVQDLEGTVQNGREVLPQELEGRIEFMAHDFFTEQPIKGADIYFFRWIFHNWSDKYSIKILRSLVPALKPGAKVMIYEHCLKDGPELRFTKKRPRDNDLIMLAQFNAHERTEPAWRALLRAADSRFKLNPIVSPEGSAFSFMEAIWTP